MLGPFSPIVYDRRFAEIDEDRPVPLKGFIWSSFPNSMWPQSLLHCPTSAGSFGMGIRDDSSRLLFDSIDFQVTFPCF